MEKMVANIQQLKESIFAVIGRDGATNFGIIKCQDNSAILIDADIRRMDEIDDGLQKTGCRNVRFLVNTHENFDHSSANDYFEKQGTTVIGSVGCQQALEEDGAVKFAEMAGRSPELKTKFPDLELGLMQITFPQEISLHLPGVDIRLIYYAHKGKSHSRGDTIAVLEQEQMVFAGDLLYTDFHPVTVYGDIPNWIQSLDNLLKLKCLCVVPGHGPVSHGGNDAYQDALLRFRSYLDDFYGRLMEVKSGKKSPGEIESYMTSGNYVSMGKTWMVKRNIEYFLGGTG